MTDQGTVRRISPEELDKILAQVQQEKHRELVLLGPGEYLSPSPQDWPDELKGRLVLQLTEYVDRLARRLLELDQIRLLILRGSRIGEAGAKIIAEHLTSLTSLDLGGNGIGEAGAKAIAEHLTSLTSLSLYSSSIGNAGARAIVENLTSLTSLNLYSNSIDNAGAKAIVENLTQLTSLNLGSNRIGEAGAKAIAEHVTSLTSLNLYSNRIGNAGAKAIVEKLTQLTSLNLGSNRISEAGARAIAEHLTQLTSLNLYRNSIGDGGARAIAENQTHLTLLNLGRNTIGEAGAEAIAENLTRLTSLDLWNNTIGDAGAKAIAENLTSLTSLNLGGNGIGEAGAKVIAKHLISLTSLNLGRNTIGEAGAKAIAENLASLTSLNLGGNKIGEAGAKAIATHLTSLASLDLGYNGIGDAGTKAIAENLTSLTLLSLGGNGIGEAGTKAIATHLTSLASLDLWDNRIGEVGTQVIAENLPGLIALNLGNNRIGDIGAEAIVEHLMQLTVLNLDNNSIGGTGAETIAEHLTQLISLDLGSNSIGDVGAQAIAEHLTLLTSLNLWNNSIGEAGVQVVAERLTSLTSLNLGSNGIGDPGAKAIAEHLTSLTSLNLDYNGVGDAGVQAIAKHLPSLTSLSLEKNSQLTSVEALSHLPMLRMVNISGTGVTDLSPLKGLIGDGLPVQWTERTYPDGIAVKGCPLVHPTPEVITQGHEAVLNYFREIEAQGVDHLFEAKVLIVGEGGAGKTSLVRRLYHPGQPLPTEDETTRGIDVHHYEFTTSENRMFRLNVWDFGGQHIYHATHQFFLTKNSLYVLVDDTRKDHKSIHDEGFKYWLEVVEVLSDASPMLIFQNEKGGRSKTIDVAGIRGRFPNVLRTLRGDLEKTGSADGMRRAIEYHVQELPHIGDEVPAKWVTIRASIEQEAKAKPYISQDDYFDIYQRHLEFDRTKALHLSRYFHDLGVFLHFQDDLALRRTVILQNRWATEAVFRILDDEKVKAERGHFTLEDCRRLWSGSQYEDMHLELLALMARFELCYRLTDTPEETWLAPQLLSPSKPKALDDWADPGDLVLCYRYTFLPKGLISRLMVRMHRFVRQPEMAWTTGALFQYEQTRVLAEVTTRGDEIILRARGPESKGLLSVIASDLDALNASFRGLEGKVDKWVPCICETCAAVTLPELFEQKRLLQRKRDGKLTIECPTSYAPVNVLTLLDGLKLEQLPGWAEEPRVSTPEEPPTIESNGAGRPAREKTVKIFLASSAELCEDRDAFDLYFRQQNDQLRKQGLYLQIVRWENFLDAMSDTRLQDEYNKEVRACDIFVSLFMTKTGRFTEEEFDVAHQAFEGGGKPLIYTFFKDAAVSTSEDHENDLKSLWAFKKKLKDLGHFHTRYKSIEDLKLRFRDQLGKLQEQGKL